MKDRLIKEINEDISKLEKEKELLSDTYDKAIITGKLIGLYRAQQIILITQ